MMSKTPAMAHALLEEGHTACGQVRNTLPARPYRLASRVHAGFTQALRILLSGPATLDFTRLTRPHTPLSNSDKTSAGSHLPALCAVQLHL